MKPYYSDEAVVQYCGDVLDVVRQLPSESVQCCVTSPPYWGLRDYAICGCRAGRIQDSSSTLLGSQAGTPEHFGRPDPACLKCGGTGKDSGVAATQLGLEATPEAYVTTMVEVFREVRRVLRGDGTLWLNLGDSYASGKGKCHNPGGGPKSYIQEKERYPLDRGNKSTLEECGLKPKDLCGIPWRVAFALQADGWWLRQDIIWSKPNPMPESVADRCTKSHEYIFLLAKSATYYYDAEAVREHGGNGWHGSSFTNERDQLTKHRLGIGERIETSGRNLRSVWSIATKPFAQAHFATFPPEIPERCIKAGTSERGCCPRCGAPWERVVEKRRTYESGSGKSGNKAAGKWSGGQCAGELEDDIRAGPCVTAVTTGWRPTCTCDASTSVPCVVLDPFSGAGTTGMMAKQLGRKAILIDLSPTYCDMARKRIEETQPGMVLA